MKTTTISELVSAVHGTLSAGVATDAFCAVATDSRTVSGDAIFFALRGDRFDAHDFLGQVAGKAAAVVVDRVPEGIDFGKTAVVVVADTLTALQAFAAWYRRSLGVDVIAITGSNGKTSTKDFTKAVLSEKFSVHATKGNFNNHVGLPLTVLELEEEHDLCVLEMGMNHSGEIEPLCQIALPRIGIITNIGTAHIEYLGSRESIAEEKGALARALPGDGVLLVSASCDFAEQLSQRSKARTIVVGNGRGAVRAEELRMSSTGSDFMLVIDGQSSVRVHLPVVGRHMVTNALLAAGAGLALGMTTEEIARGLSKTVLTSGRLRSFTKDGVVIFDDTYNANPESMKAAIETLAEIRVPEGAKRYVVLGQMAELGSHAVRANREVGELAAERGLNVLTVGELAADIASAVSVQGGSAEHFIDVEEAAEWLRHRCREGDAVLFKGSRAAAMERVMNKAFPQ